MATIMDYLKIVLLVQLFYAFAITTITHSLPDEQIHHVDIFSVIADDINMKDTAESLQENIESQANLPLIDVGALVFYSGNIILDLLINFATAMPQMFIMVINGFMILFNLDTSILIELQVFITVIITAFFAVSLLQLLTSLRTGRIT